MIVLLVILESPKAPDIQPVDPRPAHLKANFVSNLSRLLFVRIGFERLSRNL